MPSTKRERPPAKRSVSSGPSKSGPDLEDLPSAWDMTEWTKMLLYGQSRTGKTTFWGSAPGPTLALICGGTNKPGELKSINTPEHREKITPVVIQDVQTLQYVLATHAERYKYLVLDHVTALQDLVLQDILGVKELPAQKGWGVANQQEWGMCTAQCKELIRSMLNMDAHVILVAHERTFGGGDGDASDPEIRPTVAGAVTPSLSTWINSVVDYAVNTFIRKKTIMVKHTLGEGKNQRERVVPQVTKEVEYCMRTGPNDVYYTKFRMPKSLKPPDVIVDPDWETVQKIIRGELLVAAPVTQSSKK